MTDGKPTFSTGGGQGQAGGPAFEKKEQLDQVTSGLLPGETVIAVYDAIGQGTGFVGLTDRRVLLQDKSFVGKKVALTSIPYSKITTVSVISDKNWVGSFFSNSSIAIGVGTHVYEVSFRGSDKAQYVHNAILERIS